MTPQEIAEKYVYGRHDALTDRQEIKDMVEDIEAYAKDYHQGAKEGFFLGLRYGVLIGVAVTGMLMLIIEICEK